MVVFHSSCLLVEKKDLTFFWVEHEVGVILSHIPCWWGGGGVVMVVDIAQSVLFLLMIQIGNVHCVLLLYV